MKIKLFLIFFMCSLKVYVIFPLQNHYKQVVALQPIQFLFSYAFFGPYCLIDFLAADTNHF